MLEPKVLRAYAEAQLACERWDACELGGRKPSGDLRRPVPRDRLLQITKEMKERHSKRLSRAVAAINDIESGDVVGAEMLDLGVGPYEDEISIPMLIRRSSLERKQAKANRSPEEVAAAEAVWDELVESMIAELPDDDQEGVQPPEISTLPDLPADREPSEAELQAYVSAIDKHVRYEIRGEQIEAKRQRDARTKAQTEARRAAELADPEGTAAAKDAVRRAKAADRQRRWRERKKATRGKPA